MIDNCSARMSLVMIKPHWFTLLFYSCILMRVHEWTCHSFGQLFREQSHLSALGAQRSKLQQLQIAATTRLMNEVSNNRGYIPCRPEVSVV